MRHCCCRLLFKHLERMKVRVGCGLGLWAAATAAKIGVVTCETLLLRNWSCEFELGVVWAGMEESAKLLN
ncbi:hypothetical protein C2S52_017313 [Perilla frutescens var. hirtella]|nr:hypothetical protein C2S52_017313 [Perilla frutescens var. hirtella]